MKKCHRVSTNRHQDIKSGV